MATILICSVGGSPEPVVNAIKHNRPDYIYFLCSTGVKEASSDLTITQKTSQKLRGTCPKCGQTYSEERWSEPIAEQSSLTTEQYEIVPVSRPDDLADVIAACKVIQDKIGERFGTAAARVIANYTGGTKTMSVGLGFFAVRSGSWELQIQSTAIRNDRQRVTSGDLAKLQNLAPIAVTEARNTAQLLAARYDYEGAIQTVESFIARTLVAAADEDSLRKLCTGWCVLDTWERFDHEEALRIAKTEPELKARFSEALSELVYIKKTLLDGGQWSRPKTRQAALVEDLIKNAEHSASRGRYDDATARLYRATELLAQIQLSKHGIRTGNVDTQNPHVPESSKAWLEMARQPAKKNSPGLIELGLMESYRLLKEMGDPLGVHFGVKGTEDELLKTIAWRNYSILAHGFQPVTGDVWRTTGRSWIEWLKRAIAASEAAPAPVN